MTNNQIQYQKHLEDARHNAATERLTSRDIDVKQQHYERSDAENARHNRTSEGTERFKVLSTDRHYSNQDAIASSGLAETLRHNQASESLGYVNASIAQQQADTARDKLSNDRWNTIIQSVGRAINGNPIAAGIFGVGAALTTDEAQSLIGSVVDKIKQMAPAVQEKWQEILGNVGNISEEEWRRLAALTGE